MRIAITSTGETLESEVDPRFGRCAYFIIVETDTMDFEAIPNQFAMAAQGAGIQAAQFIISKGVRKIVSGDFGPNSAGILSSAGIELIRVPPGTKVKDAVEIAKSGAQPSYEAPRRIEPMGPPPVPPTHEIHSLKNELDDLKKEIEEIKKLLKEIKENR